MPQMGALRGLYSCVLASEQALAASEQALAASEQALAENWPRGELAAANWPRRHTVSW